MKFSLKTDYALRAMVEIALHHGKGSVQLKEVAQRRGIPYQYLAQLVLPLRQVGLIKSMRGPHGGYMLARDPGAITLLHILECVEGRLFRAPFSGLGKDPNGRSPLMDILEQAWEAFLNVLKTYTLLDLVERERERLEGRVTMYHI
jgi:Rrf2 family protein